MAMIQSTWKISKDNKVHNSNVVNVVNVWITIANSHFILGLSSNLDMQ